ncbi:ABC transporter ATP-binding protein [Bacillus salitolerans]|uniref:ABC transporter ATP-binding protein n=1 Tax=Bacillus salitolerans TaxID=1437434 RepID=A0ABW4LN30_9BACI
MNREIIAQLINVKKTIGNKPIIHGITFDVYKGEVFGFLGPNGAGKTTTIRMLVGLMGITEGEVIINGYSIKKNFEKAIAHVGGIIENPEMYKFLTGYQNLKHYARMMKGIKKERVEDIIKLVGLDDRIHEKVGTYSLGMRQRLGLAQALLHSPKLLILDEPTNGLDPAGIREIREYIRKVAREEHIAVLVSSHLLSEMQMMCDRIGIIQKGKLISVETVQTFMSGDEQVTLALEVEPVQKAWELLSGELNIRKDGNIVELQTTQDRIPDIVKMLVQQDCMIYEVKKTTKTLEDKFLEITGGALHA